jgi:hypothetical protein
MSFVFFSKKLNAVNLEKMFMETIVVQPSNKEEMEILKKFLQQRNIKNHVLNEEDKEDFVLGLLMQETDYNETIDWEDFKKEMNEYKKR